VTPAGTGRVGWTTNAPAKVNLDLRMRGVRDDGYHLVSTRLHTIALADRLTLVPSSEPFRIACATDGMPVDSSNLAWKGAAAMASALDVPLDGWILRLDKAVPAEAGLGGGSADAVAAARLVAAAAGVAMPPDRLATIVGALGADVAFFAWGGAMLGEGIGDQLTPLPDEAPAQVLLVRPTFGVATRDAYRWFDESGATAGGLTDEWRNDLEPPVAARHPAIRAIVERLYEAGARYAAMSGSGSACFGLFEMSRDLGRLAVGWPDGARTWQTRLLSRTEYEGATACVGSGSHDA